MPKDLNGRSIEKKSKANVQLENGKWFSYLGPITIG
jgi:hypothetical protein